MKSIARLFRTMTDGWRTDQMIILPTPKNARQLLPVDAFIGGKIVGWRQTVKNILDGKDSRFLAVVGPCSVHEEKKILEYVRWLKELSGKVAEQIFIVVRVCFEKPRTRVGWEGYLNDPIGDGSCNIAEGMMKSRRLLREIAKIGLPVASEALDQNSEQFLSDLLSMVWMGARTNESTTHRRLGSVMSMPLGVKNATSGDIASAVDFLVYVASAHTFPGLNLNGRLSAVISSGNPDAFLILRGGKRPDYAARERQQVADFLRAAGVGSEITDKCSQILGGNIRPNYTAEEIEHAIASLRKEGLPLRLVVDASHGNSEKNYVKQIEVWKSIVEQRANGNKAIVGGLLESYIKSGNQPFARGFAGLDPEISITDACLGKKETEELLFWTRDKLRAV